MFQANLLGSALSILVTEPAAAPPVASGPPERIVLPVIKPDCDRADESEAVVVCGRSDRRYRIDSSTLATLRAIEVRNDNGQRPRPRAITEGCSGVGPMDACGGNIPISAMAFRAVELAVKAIRGEDLRPALQQGPTDYDLYKQARSEEEAKKQ